jgi:hypothetical protein
MDKIFRMEHQGCGRMFFLKNIRIRSVGRCLQMYLRAAASGLDAARDTHRVLPFGLLYQAGCLARSHAPMLYVRIVSGQPASPP